MTASSNSARLAYLRLLALLVVVPVLSIAAVLRLQPKPPLASAKPPAAMVVPVSVEERADRLEGTLNLRWAPGRQVRNPGLSGIVTDVQVKTRQPVRSGTPLFSVGGATILAIIGPRPLYRDLRQGNRGDDVRMVTGLLSSLGMLQGGQRSVVSSEVVRAFGRFYRSFNFSGREFDQGQAAPPSGDAATGTNTSQADISPWRVTFSAAAVVWAGRSPFHVASSQLDVGAPMPETGEPVLTGFPSLVGAAVRPSEDAPSELVERLAASAPNEFVALADDTALPLSEAAARVQRPALAKLRRHVAPGTDALPVSIERRRPRRLLAIPATAVFPKGGTAACVLHPQSGDSEFTPVDVKVVDSSLGKSYVAVDNQLDKVLANPRQLGLQCN